MVPLAAPSQVIESTTHGTKEKVGCQSMDHEHVAKLVRDYWRHFAIYSKNHKKAVVQLISKKVWQFVFADYKLNFPHSTFKDDSPDDSLKEHL